MYGVVSPQGEYVVEEGKMQRNNAATEVQLKYSNYSLGITTGLQQLGKD